MAYQKQIWENLPSTNSPLNADRLNHMEDGIDNAYKQTKDIYSTSTTDNYSCNYVNKTNGTILWTNSSPTTNFASQTITLDETLNNYDFYEILYCQGTTSSRILSSGLIPVGYGTILNFVIGYPKYRSTENTVSGDTISFEDCKSLSSFGGGQTENSSIIPKYVIGYKTGLFS